MGRALTDTLLRSTKAPPKGRIEIADLRCVGLTFRITDNGARSWSYRFRDPQSRKLTRATIGDYPTVSLGKARAAAEKLRKQVAAGINPNAAARQERADATSKAFQHLADRYLEEHARRRKRSHAADTRNLRLHILPARTAGDARPWKDRRYDGITRADVVELLERVVARGHGTLANRLQSLISKIFAFAVDSGLLGSHPSAGLAKRGTETIGRRVLSDPEIRLFWSEIINPPVSRPVGVALRLALLTGARPGEVAGIARDEIADLDRADAAAWTIPARRSKNKFANLLPLAKLARETIAEASQLAGDSSWLFPSPAKANAPLTPHALAVAMSRFAERLSGAAPGATTWKALPPSPHDLRRTLRTRLAELGTPDTISDRILNHRPPAGDIGSRVYNLHTYRDEKARALEQWAAGLAAILSPRPSDVIPIARGRRAKASRPAG